MNIMNSRHQKASFNRLTDFLIDSQKNRVTLSVDEINEITGFSLPEEAKKYSRWWWDLNINPVSSTWRKAGYSANTYKFYTQKDLIFIKRSKQYKQHIPIYILKQAINYIIFLFWSKDISLLKKIVMPLLIISPVIWSIVLARVIKASNDYSVQNGIVSTVCLLIPLLIALIYTIHKTFDFINSMHKSTRNIIRNIIDAVILAGFVLFFSQYFIVLIIPGDHSTNCAGFYYMGEFHDGNANGDGTLIRWNGEKYEGSFSEGRYSGYGTCRFSNGDTYKGNFVYGKMHGTGEFFPANEGSYFISYAGSFEQGNLTGDGVLTLKTGEKYTGHIENGKRSGFGVLETANGCRFEGLWEDDDQNGKGTMYFPNGDKYEGQWINGFISDGDEVTYTFKDGTQIKRTMYALLEYIGLEDTTIITPDPLQPTTVLNPFEEYDQKNFSPSDFGIKGDELKNYGEDGKGIYLYSQQDVDCLNGYHEVCLVFSGDGNPLSNGDFSNTNQYNGDFYNGTMEGHGNIIFRENGKIVGSYDGEWKDGLRDGYGTERLNNATFTGVFKKDEPNGYGVYSADSGVIIKANWKIKNGNYFPYGEGSITDASGITSEGSFDSDGNLVKK